MLKHQLRQIDANFVLRAAEFADADRLAALRVAFYRTQIAADWHDLPSDLPQSMQKTTPGIIKGPRNCILLAEIGGRLVGYVFGRTKIVPGVQQAVISSIEEIFVSPDHRGVGLARCLFERILADFRSRKVNRVQLRVLAKNTAGKHFWSRLNFQENVIIYELNAPKYSY